METARIRLAWPVLTLGLVLLFCGCKEARGELETYFAAAHELRGPDGAFLVAVDGDDILSEGFGMESRRRSNARNKAPR